MGVVNVTPDSFSDGGAWLDPDKAIAHGLELAGQGADIIDVGGESTRPGAERVPEADELRRVLPVVEALASAGSYVSIDTMRAEVARQGLAAGARMVNDVSGGLADPQMPGVIAGSGVPYIVMHWRGHSADMYGPAVYGDVVAEVSAELGRRLTALTAAGVGSDQVILDPGLGFAKLPEHNWRLLAGLDRIATPPGSRPGVPGAGGRLQEGLPRQAPGGSGRAGAVLLPQRRRHDRPHRAGRRRWRLVRPRPRGSGQPRRRPGGDPVAAGEAGGHTLMPDRISIVGLRVRGRHGVFDHERADGQDFIVDAALWLDTAPAAAADDLRLTADYGAIAARLAAIVAGEPVALIETLADRLAAACLADPAVQEAEVTVHKPQAPLQQEVADVSVTIRRGRT